MRKGRVKDLNHAPLDIKGVARRLGISVLAAKKLVRNTKVPSYDRSGGAFYQSGYASDLAKYANPHATPAAEKLHED